MGIILEQEIFFGGGGGERGRLYSGTPLYDHLVITTIFLCPERIESPVISLN